MEEYNDRELERKINELEEKITEYNSKLREAVWGFKEVKSRLPEKEWKPYQNTIVEIENRLKEFREEKNRLVEEKKRRKGK